MLAGFMPASLLGCVSHLLSLACMISFRTWFSFCSCSMRRFCSSHCLARAVSRSLSSWIRFFWRSLNLLWAALRHVAASQRLPLLLLCVYPLCCVAPGDNVTAGLPYLEGPGEAIYSACKYCVILKANGDMCSQAYCSRQDADLFFSFALLPPIAPLLKAAAASAALWGCPSGPTNCVPCVTQGTYEPM